MLEPRRAVLFDVLDLERRLLDVYMEFLAEHDSSRRRPRGQEHSSAATPRMIRVDAGPGYLRAITMPAARSAWPTLVTSKRSRISHTHLRSDVRDGHLERLTGRTHQRCAARWLLGAMTSSVIQFLENINDVYDSSFDIQRDILQKSFISKTEKKHPKDVFRKSLFDLFISIWNVF